MLAMVTAATDLTLLDVNERRRAIGVLDGAADADLLEMDQRASQVIAAYLNVARVGVLPLTIRAETVTETIRLERPMSELATARRFITSITSVIEDGDTLTTGEYEFNGPSGLIWRLSDDHRMPWLSCKVVATYTSGFTTVPFDIKLAASRLISSFYREAGRDPNIRRVRVDGISEREYFRGANDDPAVPFEVKEILAPYRTRVMA